jgi:hypothetical protein
LATNQRRRFATSSIVFGLSALTVATPSAEATSTFDTSFGAAGIIIDPATSAVGGTPAISARPDGKILYSHGYPNVTIQRLGASGVADSTFAPQSATPGSIVFNGATDVAFEQAGGAIVRVIGPPRRYMPDGSIDVSYGVTGPFTSIAVRSDNYLIGVYGDFSTSSLSVVRPNGQPETSFNPSNTLAPGTIQLPILSGFGTVQIGAVAVGATGRAAVALTGPGGGDVFIVDTKSTATQPPTSLVEVRALRAIFDVAVDASGNVYAVGPSAAAPYDEKLIRIDANGIANLGSLISVPGARSLDLGNDNSILVGGTGGTGARAWRVLSSGALDLSFGSDGAIAGAMTIKVSGSISATASSMAQLPNGSVLVAGTSALTDNLQSLQRHFVAQIRTTPEIPGNGSLFNPVSPRRIVDSRSGLGVPRKGKVAATVPLVVTVAGFGGVPNSGASAVLANVTVVDPVGDGFATVYPCNSTPPDASNLNFRTGRNVANQVHVPLSQSGTVCIVSTIETHILVDVAGWDGASGLGFGPSSPIRILDTRGGAGRPLFAGEVRSLDLYFSPGITPRAVTLNVTVANPSSAGFVTVFPCNANPPDVSNLNFVAGENRANLVTVPVGPIRATGSSGSVCFFSSSATHLIADQAGLFADSGSLYTATSPARILDTRSGLGAPSGRRQPGQQLTLQVSGRGGLPANKVAAVTMNVTVVGPEGAGFASVFPCDSAEPGISNINYVAGNDVPNLVTVKVSPAGTVCVTTSAVAHVLADVAGWYAVTS